VLAWGASWLAIKFQLGQVAPEWSIVYRFALAAGLLMAFCGLRGLGLRFGRRQHLYLALQGLLLFSLNYILVYLAEVTLPSGLVAVVFSSVVILNVFFGALFLKAPIRRPVLLGGVLGLAGLGLIFWPEIAASQARQAWLGGLGLTVGATISASLGNIVSARNQRAGLPVVQTNAWGVSYGAGFMLLLALLRGAPPSIEATPAYLGSLVYLAIIATIVAFGAYLTLLGRIGPDRAGYAFVLFPVVALALSTLFEGLHWNLLGLLGVGLVLTGNGLALYGRRSDRTR
jgi:drug/metabolite transporter (DMT)-like permease